MKFPRRYLVAIGLGANLEDREATLRSAVTALESLAAPGADVRVSPLYETDAVGGPPQPRFLNAAVRLGMTLAPELLLDALLRIEAGHRRVRAEKWGPRTLDLDVLYALDWGAETPLGFSSEHLAIPHPHLFERSFALAPLLDVFPELVPSFGAALTALGGPPPVYRRAPHDAAEWPWPGGSRA